MKRTSSKLICHDDDIEVETGGTPKSAVRCTLQRRELFLIDEIKNSKMLREIRECRTTNTLLQLLEAAADDASQGTTGSSASTTTRADLSAAAMEKHASDPALWTTDVAVAFGKLMCARARAGLDGDAARAAIADGALSASDAAAADAAVASPLAVLLSKEEARSRCAMIAFMCATTVQLFAVLIFSVAVNRSFGYFYALNIALFLISVLPLLVVLIHTALTCCSHEASRQLLPKLLLASEVYYIGLHLIALLGVIALVTYLVTITASVDEWCGKYLRLPIVNGTVSGATSSSRCPAKDSSSYDWMVVGAAAAAVGSCALFLAVVELGCRLASKWASLARFSATDGLTRSMAEDRGALPLLDDDARPVAATAAAALSTPLRCAYILFDILCCNMTEYFTNLMILLMMRLAGPRTGSKSACTSPRFAFHCTVAIWMSQSRRRSEM